MCLEAIMSHTWHSYSQQYEGYSWCRPSCLRSSELEGAGWLGSMRYCYSHHALQLQLQPP